MNRSNEGAPGRSITPGADFLHLAIDEAPGGGKADWLARQIRRALADGRLPVGSRLLYHPGPGRGTGRIARRGHRGLPTPGRGRALGRTRTERNDRGRCPHAGDEGGRFRHTGRTRRHRVPCSPRRPAPRYSTRCAGPGPASTSPRDSPTSPRSRERRGCVPNAASSTTSRHPASATETHAVQPALRLAIAHWIARNRGIRADPDEVLIVAGTAQTLTLLGRVLRDEGVCAIAVEDPGSLGARQHLHNSPAGHPARRRRLRRRTRR